VVREAHTKEALGSSEKRTRHAFDPLVISDLVRKLMVFSNQCVTAVLGVFHVFAAVYLRRIEHKFDNAWKIGASTINACVFAYRSAGGKDQPLLACRLQEKERKPPLFVACYENINICGEDG
jgi:hypothetical protein